ncbi:hypothetical protein ACJJIK_06240 [Microbulbifer sp. ZKSA006]|uniref:hypothetical protein n=1 Tax=Microbulbifer sp. ZKSA006 TaxID=3243390 RepID=UPI004039B6DF
MYYKLLITLFLLVVGVKVSANSSTENVSINKLESWSSGSIFVNTDESEKTNPAKCSTTDKYILSSNAPEMTKSMLLSSYIADKSINLVVYSGGCELDRPLIVAVYFDG